MKIFLDEMPMSREADSVTEALRLGAEAADLVGRIIVQVSADGHRLSDREIEEIQQADAKVREIRLESADPHHLVAGVFAECRSALESVGRAQNAAADACATGHTADVLRELGEIAGVWQSVRDGLEKGAAALGIEVERLNLRVDDRTVSAPALVRGLATALGDAQRAVKGEDWSALGDVLALDLHTLCEQWGELFAALERSVVSRGR